MKKLLCTIAAFLLILSMASCAKSGQPAGESGSGASASSSAAVSPQTEPDETLSASLTKLLTGHSEESWYHHIEKSQVLQQGGIYRAEITLKADSTKYSSAAVILSGLFSAEQIDAFFPGLCGAAEVLGLSSAEIAEIGKLFYNLTTQDDAQNYAQIERYGLPVYQMLADITGEKVSKIKADIDSRIVDDAKVAHVLFQALNETYSAKSKEITQSEMTQISGAILTEFQDAAIGKIIFKDAKGMVLKEIGSMK